MKHFLNINEMSTEDLTGILKHAQKMKTDRLDLPKGTYDEGQPLSQHIVALVFEKPSTRTRTSFDVGVRQHLKAKLYMKWPNTQQYQL
jgi:ornithine carbamoyltransferase